MFNFDLAKEPLTNLELKAELQTLKDLRKVQIKYSCVSDVLHAFIFITLYFNHFLSGYAILIAVGISTIVALMLATISQKNLVKSGPITIVILSIGTAITTGILLTRAMNESFIGSLIAAIAAGSIVIMGATLGRKIKNVMTSIESMKPIIDDETSWQQVMNLCRKYPELDEYRESAAQYLRPHLTYGELKEMEKWGQEQT